MVVMTVKFDMVPAATWSATVKCGEGCSKTIPLPSINAVPPGKWITLGWPLRCFALSQQDTSHVSAAIQRRDIGFSGICACQDPAEHGRGREGPLPRLGRAWATQPPLGPGPPGP